MTTMMSDTPPTAAKRKSRLSVLVILSLLWLAAVVVATIFGEHLARYGATVAVGADRLQPPSPEHWAGTDNFSRDIMDRLIVAARSSMFIGVSVAVISSILGGATGVIAVVWKPLDNIVMRVLDGFIAFPPILLAIMLVASFGGGYWQVILALTLVFFPRIARVVRAATLAVITAPYVEASRVLGGNTLWSTRHHVIPNITGPLAVQATYVLSRAIVIDAGLAFLGLGVPPPAPTWGSMLGDSRLFVDQAWWLVVLPGLCIVLTALAVNFAGDWVRDLTDRTLGTDR
ncbi:ABC transporter permease [Brevibacterium linens]|uniref:Peptide/nickel transport system permease protein n=1 Tax=Brevibacterium linens TaxID=1703 RepID=A0A2H1KNC7_BRELN|nr:ABC transporter permease [Brevibacterium linens]SMY01246.1 peptide/nickel transport system permease protein [Brevibacterium linens]